VFDIMNFAHALLAKGMELTLRKDRLHVWPKHSYSRLTQDERNFLNQYRDDLRDMVRAGLQPRLPDDVIVNSPNATDHPDFAPPTEPAPPERCVYCGQSPCVGPNHQSFRVLHWRDPAEIERRRQEARRI
jgi:hypothetical protein